MNAEPCPRATFHQPQVAEGMLLVQAIARQLQSSFGRVLSHDDMISLGNEGLVDAMIRFDPARGVEFKPYASQRIRGAILDGMRREGMMPRRTRPCVAALARAIPGRLLLALLPGAARSSREPRTTLPRRIEAAGSLLTA